VKDLGEHSATPPIVYAPFPLDLERYAELVRSTDIGLLLYDSTRYYARCSGVLLEMLSAGVPVIVPGGCWLSEQIHDENQRHLREIAANATALKHITGGEMSWKPSLPSGGAISFTQSPAVAEFTIPTGARSLLLRFRWVEPMTRGTYAHLDLEQSDAQGQRLGSFAAIVEPGNDPAAVYSLFHLHANATHARLKWRNAWDIGRISISNIDCQLFVEHHPAGSVGLTAANMDQSGELLSDVLMHMDHYRRRSAAFAPRCTEYFNADQIVAQLLATASAPPSIPQPLPKRLDLATPANVQSNAG
jgi:hypothetical protein